jgi:hypothetical protein
MQVVWKGQAALALSIKYDKLMTSRVKIQDVE